jgi:hypothetical protein
VLVNSREERIEFAVLQRHKLNSGDGKHYCISVRFWLVFIMLGKILYRERLRKVVILNLCMSRSINLSHDFILQL